MQFGKAWRHPIQSEWAEALKLQRTPPCGWGVTVHFPPAYLPVEQVQPIMSALLDPDPQTLSSGETFPSPLLPLPSLSPFPLPWSFVVLLGCFSSSSLLLFVFEHLHLALSTSLPLSLSSPSASQILFIYGKVAADAALSLSSEVYVPLWRLSRPFWAVFHPCARGQASGTEELLYLYCWREHHNLCEYSTARCMSHVVFHESWVMIHHDQHYVFFTSLEKSLPQLPVRKKLYIVNNMQRIDE